MDKVYKCGLVSVVEKQSSIGDVVLINIVGSEPVPIFKKHIVILFETVLKDKVHIHELDIHVDSYTLNDTFVTAIVAPYKDSVYEVRLCLNVDKRKALLDVLAQYIYDLNPTELSDMVVMDDNLEKLIMYAMSFCSKHTGLVM